MRSYSWTPVLSPQLPNYWKWPNCDACDMHYYSERAKWTIFIWLLGTEWCWDHLSQTWTKLCLSKTLTRGHICNGVKLRLLRLSREPCAGKATSTSYLKGKARPLNLFRVWSHSSIFQREIQAKYSSPTVLVHYKYTLAPKVTRVIHYISKAK
jgi:hypothetical protein